MKILYLSALSSVETVNRIYKETGQNPGYAAQNFNRLVVKGFLQNGVEVRVLSTLPIPISSFKGRFLGNKTDVEENVVYKYIPFINLPILRQIGIGSVDKTLTSTPFCKKPLTTRRLKF